MYAPRYIRLITGTPDIGWINQICVKPGYAVYMQHKPGYLYAAGCLRVICTGLYFDGNQQIIFMQFCHPPIN